MRLPIQNDVALSGKTTLRIGGPARYYFQPACRADVTGSLAWAREQNLPVFVLGNGSNVLVSDAGWPGLVIDIGARFMGITWNEAYATCACGASLNHLVRQMLDRGLRGLETLGGIPGSIGGAVVMNAGAYGHSIAECVQSVDFYDSMDALIKSLPVEELQAGYRQTVFTTKPAVILSVRFQFQPDTAGSAQETWASCIAKRKEKHPLDLPNCGSVFKNPRQTAPSVPAAHLIESSGLKGYKIGDAEVSQKHANFIVNHGHATAAEVRRVIVHIQKTVYEKHGVLLEPEVVFVGEFEEALFRPQ